MREILFRGRNCLDEKDWVYGNLEDRNGDYHITSWFIRPKSDNYLDCEGCMVDNETVGQFTGVNDKNGVKIFEGDILRHKYGHTFNKLYTIVFDDGAFCFKTDGYIIPLADSEFGIVGSNCLIDDCEVIGNIHDNPELLEV